MLYYDFKVTVNDTLAKEDDNEFVHKNINVNVATLNEKQAYNVRFFINDIKGNVISLCGVIGYKNNDDPMELAEKFITDLGHNVIRIDGGETTAKHFAHLIRKADLNDFIDDDDAVLSMACLGNFREATSKRYTEALVEDSDTDESIIEMADSLNCGNSLKDEVKRILAMPMDHFIGHPVHYILTVDDMEVARKIVMVLTKALYKAKRIKSRRIDFIEAELQSCGLPWEEEDVMTLNVDLLKTLYASIPGGTLVVGPGRIDYETETVNSEQATIDDLTKLILDNRRDCLSVLVFSKDNRKSAEKLKSALNTIRFVEIHEELFNQVTARNILLQKATEDKIADPASLLAKIPEDEEKYFYISDVNKIYSDWLDERLGTEVFPLYSEIKLPERKAQETIGDAYEKLQNLIGLKSAKQVVNEALDFCKYQKMFFDSGLSDLRPARHMVFTGNPGTAKTTVARLFAQIMKDNKVLPKGKLIEVGRKDLVGKYVGWTAKLVEKAFHDARGSILFIDEAYSLCDDRDGMYGDEAINTIVQMMENQRDDTIVIFAGYPDKMQAFLDKNPGLRSRIAFHVNFDDYNEDELVDILKLMARENNVKLDPTVDSKVRDILSRAIDKKDFGNGRFVRNIFERARMRQASRIVGMDGKGITNDVLSTLIDTDFIMPDELENRPNYRTIGFAS